MTIHELESALSEATQGLIENTSIDLAELFDNDPILKKDAVELVRQLFYAIDASNAAIVKFLKQKP